MPDLPFSSSATKMVALLPMNERYTKWYTPWLSREFEMLVFGDRRGLPLGIIIGTGEWDVTRDEGVTNTLSRRTWRHRENIGASFSARYQCKKLIYYEHYRDIRDAIARESQLKKWSRAKKVALINRMNSWWQDLGADVLQGL